MAHEIVLPSLSAGMEEAVIARWLKAEGESVAVGEVLAEVETDKATMELEAEASGRVGRLLVAEGSTVAVGAAIAVLLAEGEDAAALPPGDGAGAFPAASAPSAPAPVAPVYPPVAPVAAVPAPQAPVPVASDADRTAPGPRHSASPLARRLAAERGIDLAGLAGSGPRGRIVRVDVERAAARPAAAARPEARVPPADPAPAFAPGPSAAPGGIPPGIGAHEALPVSNVRRVIARRLLEAKTTIPHFYLQADCEIDALLALRAQLNAGRAEGERISVNDFVLKAVAAALRAVPEANVIWTEDALLRLRAVDISVAVATEGGLITPVLRDADIKSLGAISAEVRALAARARDGKLKPGDYQGGGFSVSNLGMYGVKSFSAIINPPQSAILAVGAGERRPVGRGDQIVLATVMSCTLSVDHRSVDGALGARLLAAFKAGVEAPLGLLV